MRTQRDAPLNPSGCHFTLEMGVEAGPWKNSPTALRRHSTRCCCGLDVWLLLLLEGAVAEGVDQSLRLGKTMTTT